MPIAISGLIKHIGISNLENIQQHTRPFNRVDARLFNLAALHCRVK